MTDSLPLSLIMSWVVFFGFVNTHQRHAHSFQGASQGYFLALQASVIIGSLVGLGLLCYYFMQVVWYWPIVLFLVGSLVDILGYTELILYSNCYMQGNLCHF